MVRRIINAGTYNEEIVLILKIDGHLTFSEITDNLQK